MDTDRFFAASLTHRDRCQAFGGLLLERVDALTSRSEGLPVLEGMVAPCEGVEEVG